MQVRHERFGELALPDFLLVGAAKSATTSLYHYLRQHPGICMTSIKESWFFSFFGNPPRYAGPGALDNVVSSVEEYVKLFEGARADQKLGDASPSYLYTYRETLHNIRALYPPSRLENLRIVVSLREPVSRSYSQYWTFRRFAEEPLPFDQAIEDEVVERRLRENWNIFYDYKGFGRYYEQLKAYLAAFGKERVLIVLFEDIQKDPRAVCRGIFAFLGVDPDFVPNTSVRYNDIAGEPRNKWLLRILRSRNPVKRTLAAGVKGLLERLPREATLKAIGLFVRGVFRHRRVEMTPQTRAKLARFFVEDVKRLEDLIGRDLSHWRGGGA